MSNLWMYRKNDKSWTINFTSNSTPINITGYSVLFTVKKRVTDSAIISKTITSHTTPISGITTLTISKTDSLIDVGTYVYDLILVDGSNNRLTFDDGTFTIKQNITD